MVAMCYADDYSLILISMASTVGCRFLLALNVSSYRLSREILVITCLLYEKRAEGDIFVCLCWPLEHISKAAAVGKCIGGTWRVGTCHTVERNVVTNQDTDCVARQVCDHVSVQALVEQDLLLLETTHSPSCLPRF
jgi:hypothetical protein